MDPKATLEILLDSTIPGGHARTDLNDWLRKGGFAPRVELHPATGWWMMGDRFGAVVNVGRKYLWVKMDRSGRTLRISPRNIYAAL